MTDLSTKDVTRLLVAWRNGDQCALDRLMPLIYDELHRLAHRYTRRERPGHTLQTTALVHEAYLRLIELKDITWRDRVHFFAVAAQMMRRVLVDYAKRYRAAKRGSGKHKLSLAEATDVAQGRAPDLLALDEALQSLATIDRRKSQIVELRFFGGLTIEETAEVLAISHATVERELKIAMAWLGREVKR